MHLRRTSARWIAACAAAALALQGCISAGAPVTQTVRVETPGCARASCELSNDRGTWHVASTPGTATLTSSGQALRVSCRAEGSLPNSAGVAAKTRELSSGAAVVGGVTGGAAVGVAFGGAALSFIPVLGVIVVAAGIAGGAMAAQAADSRSRPQAYPEVVSVPMQCAAGDAPAATSATPAVGLALGMQLRGASVAEARAAGIGERAALLIVEVSAGGHAAAAGLRAGDWILSLDGEELADPAVLEARWRSGTAAGLTLGVWREGRSVELRLTPPSTPRP